METIPTRVCVQCGIPKPIKDGFYAHRRKCKECIKLQVKTYAETHKELLSAAKHRRYSDPVNAEKARAYHREYDKTPAGKRRRHRSHARRKLLLARVEGHLTRRQLNAFRAAHPYCMRCGTTVDLTTDHVIPISLGGPDREDNLQVLCHNCNSLKGQKIIDYRPIRVELPLRVTELSNYGGWNHGRESIV